MDKFQPHLKEHQLAETGDGENNVFTKAILEHNIQVVSNIYQTISFDGLGRFLNIRPDKAEQFISKMIIDGKIEAVIDQKVK